MTASAGGPRGPGGRRDGGAHRGRRWSSAPCSTPGRASPGGWPKSRRAAAGRHGRARPASCGSSSTAAAQLDVAGQPGRQLHPDQGLLLPPGMRFSINGSAVAGLRLDAVALPGTAGQDRRDQPDRPGPQLRDLRDCDVETTGDRKFRVLFGPGRGCAVATQFVGEIPPGRAPEHSHPYDEVVLVLAGARRAARRRRRLPAGRGQLRAPAAAAGALPGEHRARDHARARRVPPGGQPGGQGVARPASARGFPAGWCCRRRSAAIDSISCRNRRTVPSSASSNPCIAVTSWVISGPKKDQPRVIACSWTARNTRRRSRASRIRRT